jgi:ribosomal protein S12 methylthiotransferase
MKRPAAAENNLARIRAWRAICPEITLRSTFIVGFPGETEADFQMLLDFLEQAQLDRVGCFEYSPVEGARANELPGPVPDDLKQDRYQRFMETQARISAERLQSKVGRAIDVLIDEVDDNEAIGRSHADAPEIDGRVYVEGGGALLPGALIRVEVTGADEYDLYGRIAG